MTFRCVACNSSFSENPSLILLNGRGLCSSCFTVIKSGSWCANPEHSYSKNAPKPPTLAQRIVGKLSGSDPQGDYESRLREHNRLRAEYILTKERERESFHEICTYWPKDQPPDWLYRVNGAKKRTGDKCEECGESSDTLHVHHKIPRSQGGNHSISNLIVLCTSCHSRKEGGGHQMILPPRSGNADSEKEVVRTIQSTLGVWISREVSTVGCCSICKFKIDIGETYKEFIIPVRRKNWEVHFRRLSPREAFKKSPVLLRRARKEHSCRVCGGPIMSSEEYIEILHLWEVVYFRYEKYIPIRICLDHCSRRTVCVYCYKRYGLEKAKLDSTKFRRLVDALPIVGDGKYEKREEVAPSPSPETETYSSLLIRRGLRLANTIENEQRFKLFSVGKKATNER